MPPSSPAKDHLCVNQGNAAKGIYPVFYPCSSVWTPVLMPRSYSCPDKVSYITILRGLLALSRLATGMELSGMLPSQTHSSHVHKAFQTFSRWLSKSHWNAVANQEMVHSGWKWSRKDTAWSFWGFQAMITLILGHGSSCSRFPPCQHKSARPRQIPSPSERPYRQRRMCWDHLILFGLDGTIDFSLSFREKWPEHLFQKVVWPPVDWGITGTQVPARLSAPGAVCLLKPDGCICLGRKWRTNSVCSTVWAFLRSFCVISCPSLCPEATRHWLKQHALKS